MISGRTANPVIRIGGSLTLYYLIEIEVGSSGNHSSCRLYGSRMDIDSSSRAYGLTMDIDSIGHHISSKLCGSLSMDIDLWDRRVYI